MQPIVRSGIRAILVLRFNCRFHTRKAGRIAKVKSEMTLKALYRYASPMMTSMLIQVPDWRLFQK